MKSSVIVAFWMMQVLGSVGQPAVSPLPQPKPSVSWLGLRVTKPDLTVTKHVPSLPPGIGFVVKSIDAGGPAETAGLLEFDLIWKLNDQWLVNEAQLAVLLRISKPGDEVVLAGFREGKPLEVKLTLGKAPATTNSFPPEMLDSSVLPGVCPGPMRMVDVADKSASFSSDEGRAVVRRDGELYQINIAGTKGEVIFEEKVNGIDSLEKVPEKWRMKVQVLCRTLDQALSGQMVPLRQPRPRVVPPVGVLPSN